MNISENFPFPHVDYVEEKRNTWKGDLERIGRLIDQYFERGTDLSSSELEDALSLIGLRREFKHIESHIRK